MTGSTLIWRNMLRNKVRTSLTLGSLAFSLFLFTILHAFADAMRSVGEHSANQHRLVVHHETTMTQPLPIGHGDKIAIIPGVRAVCGMRWFGGRLENSQEQFPSLAAETDPFPVVYADAKLTDEEIDAWRTERTAAVLGSGLAKRMRWTCGRRVTLTSTIPPYPTLEFRIVAITEAKAYSNVFIFRLDYLIDSMGEDPMLPLEHAGAVNFFWVKID